MKVSFRGVILASILLSTTGLFAGSVTYTYTGNDYVNPAAPYTAGEFESGSFTLSNPLGDNLMNQGVTPLSFSFTDGYETITNLTPNLLASLFYFYTNSVGAITDWELFLFVSPYTSPVAPFATTGYQFESISCGPCSTVPLGPGSQIFPSSHDHVGLYPGVSTDVGYVQSNPGTWTVSPEPSSVSLIIAGAILLVGKMRFQRAHQRR